MKQEHMEYVIILCLDWLQRKVSTEEFRDFLVYFDEKDFHPVWNCDEECCPDVGCECGDCDSCHGEEEEVLDE